AADRAARCAARYGQRVGQAILHLINGSPLPVIHKPSQPSLLLPRRVHDRTDNKAVRYVIDRITLFGTYGVGEKQEVSSGESRLVLAKIYGVGPGVAGVELDVMIHAMVGLHHQGVIAAVDTAEHICQGPKPSVEA